MMQMFLPGGNPFLASGLLGQSGNFWLPPAESTSADIVDAVFQLILAVSVFFFLLIVILMVVFVFLYRRRAGVEPSPTVSQNTFLEVLWTVVPVAIVIVIFYVGFTGYMDLRTPPANAYEIRVTAQKWSWIFSYPNGYVSDKLHVPQERPSRLTMTSQDVIHSLFVPAFRLKMDVVPGRYTVTWFQAHKAGEYDLYCAEYCGKGHSEMLSKVIVHEAGTFESWLAKEADVLARLTPVEAGAELYRRYGCAGCHSTDATAKTGPSFRGIYGKTHDFANAPATQVDDNYLRESILEPMKKIRSGYQGVMPTYQGRFAKGKEEEEIAAIIEYIKSLTEK